MNQKAKILIVDDEQIILDMYGVAFEVAGMHVYKADNAEEGLKIALAEKPDIIYTDIVMPDKDGFWLLREIKKNHGSETASIPVIMLTNMDDPDTRKTCCDLGCLFYLVKPNHIPSNLVAMAKEILTAKKLK